ncbi:SDR family oxidoreductase [Geopsychrobacter electrodiphilus]|uniref:SDR family oxidoreductase n=1 Tax=Geopsychrobacter electrodiphilus TaxID=225196 RepID=UPI00036A7705|nr:SDR family oxidoreductase [Geopsychrobacter electrodiphilus]
MKMIFFAGFGDIARRISQQAEVAPLPQAVITRTEEKFAALAARGFETILGSFDDPANLEPLPLAGRTVFYTAPPPGGGYTDPRVGVFCDQITSDNLPAKVIYISTSGVYGDCGGELVDEQTPLNPQTTRAKRRVDAEVRMQSMAAEFSVPLLILRVTGIYGPTRLPLQRLRQNHPVLTPEESNITNRIHAEDLARVCVAAALKGEAGDIFNVSDGEHGTMTDYFNAVADCFGLPRPVQISRAEANLVMNPLMLSYIDESRRMDNRKMLHKLGIQLLYPGLIAGLNACKKELEA